MNYKDLDNEYLSTNNLKKIGFNKFGKNCQISTSCYMKGVKNISFGNNVRIDSYVNIIAISGYLKIANNVHIGSRCHLVCNGGIEIDNFAGLSQDVKLYSVSDDYSGKFLTNPTIPNEYKKIITKNIKIKEHAIIGAGSVILPGVILETGAAIGANTVIRKSTKEFTIHNGNPSRQIGVRSKDLLKYADDYKKKLKFYD
jgi:galactoside O-acetyltransferase